MNFALPAPELQIEFSVALAEIRRRYLQDALQSTVATLSIPELDKELASFVPANAIQSLAAHSLRGELVFAVPLILAVNPFLLGYYRLLYGYSQKQFYTTQTGFGTFKSMEESGTVPTRCTPYLKAACEALAVSGAALVEGIGVSRLSANLLDDLTLLTVGPQLRGGRNVKKGARGIVQIFEAINQIVGAAALSVNAGQIILKNAAGRRVFVEFAPDPDIVIREEMGTGFAAKIAIEVKAGEDFSNIHNRIGEAEKSHQKARQRGFVEFWTVVNVDRIDLEMAHRESPTTNRFYRLSEILRGKGSEFTDFKNRVQLLIGT